MDHTGAVGNCRGIGSSVEGKQGCTVRRAVTDRETFIKRNTLLEILEVER